MIGENMPEPEVTLPPMIQPSWREVRPTNPPKPGVDWYSREKVIEYATAAVLADREARG